MRLYRITVDNNMRITVDNNRRLVGGTPKEKIFCTGLSDYPTMV